MNVGWNCNSERLLGLLVLDDSFAPLVCDQAGEGFYRGFLVQDRKSANIVMRMRFRYRDGDSWSTLTPKSQEQTAAVAEIRAGMMEVFSTASLMMGIPFAPQCLQMFEPPDDGGHFEKTIEWLLEKDLIHPPQVVKGGLVS